MGAWGTGIFDSDLAQDVRDEWREALMDARAPEFDDDERDEPEFWIALAAAQHETGRLDDDVRDRALEAIDAGADLELWEGRDRKRRAKALDKLARKLRGEQPKPKLLRRPKRHDPGVVVGDVLRVWDPQRRRSALFGVVSPEPELLGLYWDGVEVPPREELELLPPLLDTGAQESWISMPLVHWGIVTGRRSEAFGPHVGEIVARGVVRATAAAEASTCAGWDPGVREGDVLRIGATLWGVVRIGGGDVLPGCPVIAALDWEGDAVPPPEELARLSVRPLRPAYEPDEEDDEDFAELFEGLEMPPEGWAIRDERPFDGAIVARGLPPRALSRDPFHYTTWAALARP